LILSKKIIGDGCAKEKLLSLSATKKFFKP
jgi:hypothetical protein